MTPAKKKIKELIDKFSCLHLGEDYNKWKDKKIIFDDIDVECAIILVKEMIKFEKRIVKNIEKTSILNGYKFKNEGLYYESILNELEKL